MADTYMLGNAQICTGCDYVTDRCHCNADELDREFDLKGGRY